MPALVLTSVNEDARDLPGRQAGRVGVRKEKNQNEVLASRTANKICRGNFLTGGGARGLQQGGKGKGKWN
jgi:hypothetical protein